MSTTVSNVGTISNVVILLARIALGVTLFAHGWQKFFTNGIDATAQGFDSMGVPAATASAIFAAAVELVGGALLIIGLLTPLVAVLVVVDMAGAFWFAHRTAGTIFVSDGGYELVLVLAAGAALVGAVAGGRYGVDGMLRRRRGAAAR